MYITQYKTIVILECEIWKYHQNGNLLPLVKQQLGCMFISLLRKRRNEQYSANHVKQNRFPCELLISFD